MKDLSDIEWDDAQRCDACNNNFLVDGRERYDKCPDCGGELRVVTKEEADSIESILDTFPMDNLKDNIKGSTVNTFTHHKIEGEGKVMKCDACRDIVPVAANVTQCPQCNGPLKELGDDLSDFTDLKTSFSQTYSVSCPQCGEMTQDDNQPKFCSNCGAKLIIPTKPFQVIHTQSKAPLNTSQIYMIVALIALVFLVFLILS